MLVLILMLLFGVIAIAGLMFVIGGFASGVGHVVGAKRRGEAIQPTIPDWALREAREIGAQDIMSQTTTVNVNVIVNGVPQNQLSDEEIWSRLMALSPELRRARYVEIRDIPDKAYDRERALLLEAERLDDEAKQGGLKK